MLRRNGYNVHMNQTVHTKPANRIDPGDWISPAAAGRIAGISRQTVVRYLPSLGDAVQWYRTPGGRIRIHRARWKAYVAAMTSGAIDAS